MNQSMTLEVRSIHQPKDRYSTLVGVSVCFSKFDRKRETLATFDIPLYYLAHLSGVEEEFITPGTEFNIGLFGAGKMFPVIVTIDLPNLRPLSDIQNDLKSAGFRPANTETTSMELPEGIIFGNAAASDISKIRLVPGVSAAEAEQTFRIA